MAEKPKLTHKQAAFVDEYLIDLNATQAVLRAGYSEKTAGKIATENLQKPVIQEAIAAAMLKRQERTRVSQDRVVLELARIAFSDMKEFTRWGAEGVTLLMSDDLSADDAQCVQEVTETITQHGGTIKFKLHSKTPALKLLGEHMAMFTKNVRVDHLNLPDRIVVELVDPPAEDDA